MTKRKTVEPLRSRTMTLEQLQRETLKLITKIRKQFNRMPHEDGLTDKEFMDQVLLPFRDKIKTDMYILKAAVLRDSK